jgi:hypothetical protein
MSNVLFHAVVPGTGNGSITLAQLDGMGEPDGLVKGDVALI